MKEVVIKNYIESASSSELSSQCGKDPIRGINPSPHPLFPRTNQRTQQPYDRRARLLAYAQELRHANDNRRPELKTMKKSRLKLHKKWRWARRIRSSFHQLFHRTNAHGSYERILTEEYSDGEDANCEKGLKWRKRSAKERRTSHFCMRFKALLKEFSCVWKFNKEKN